MMTFQEYVEARSTNEGKIGRFVGNVLGGAAGLLGGIAGGGALGAAAGTAVSPGAGTALGGFAGGYAGGMGGAVLGAKRGGEWGSQIGDNISYAFSSRPNKVLASSRKVAAALQDLKNDMTRAKQQNKNFLPSFDAIMQELEQWSTKIANLSRHIDNRYNNAQNPLTALTPAQAAASRKPSAPPDEILHPPARPALSPLPPTRKKSPPPGLRPTTIPNPPKI